MFYSTLELTKEDIKLYETSKMFIDNQDFLINLFAINNLYKAIAEKLLKFITNIVTSQTLKRGRVIIQRNKEFRGEHNGRKCGMCNARLSNIYAIISPLNQDLIYLRPSADEIIKTHNISIGTINGFAQGIIHSKITDSMIVSEFKNQIGQIAKNITQLDKLNDWKEEYNFIKDCYRLADNLNATMAKASGKYKLANANKSHVRRYKKLMSRIKNSETLIRHLNCYFNSAHFNSTHFNGKHG